MKIYVEETKKGDYAVVADFGTRAEKFFFKWHEEDIANTVATLIQEVIDTTGGDFSTCRAVFDSDAKQVNVFIGDDEVGGLDIDSRMVGSTLAAFINRVFEMG